MAYPILATTLTAMQDGAAQSITLTPAGLAAITESDLIGNCTIDRYCFTSNRIEIGTAIAAELKFGLNINSWGTTSLLGKEIYVGMTVNGEVIPQGYFIVDSETIKANTKTITALDRMAKFDVLIESIEEYFPTTLNALVNAACTACGITLKETFINTYAISNPPASTGVTWRHIIQWAAGITGKCAYIDWDGKLRFEWLNSTTTALTSSDRFTSKNDNAISTDGVQIVDAIDYTSGGGTYPILLKNNLLIQSNYQTMANSLYSQLGTVTYSPFTCKTKAYPHIWPLDIISYTPIGGTALSAIVSHVKHKLNGQSLIEGAGESSVNASYAPVANSTIKALAEVRRNITAQGAQIGLVAENGSIKAAEIVAAINDTESSVKISADHITLSGKTINLTSDDIAINSTNFSVTPSGKVIAKDGDIAGWEITPAYIRKAISVSGHTYEAQMYAPEGFSSGYGIVAFGVKRDNTFISYIDYSGRLVATEGELSGNIQIQGACIVNGTLYAAKLGRNSNGAIALDDDVYVGGALTLKTDTGTNNCWLYCNNGAFYLGGAAAAEGLVMTSSNIAMYVDDILSAHGLI